MIVVPLDSPWHSANVFNSLLSQLSQIQLPFFKGSIYETYYVLAGYNRGRDD